LTLFVKRLLLAIYNPVVLTFRKSLRWASAFTGSPWTSCSVCGRRGPKLFVPEAVGDELVAMWGLTDSDAFELRLKESLICPWCGSKHRARRLATVIARELRTRNDSDSKSSVPIGSHGEDANSDTILILNRIDGLDRMRIPETIARIVRTDYAEGAEPGEIVRGVRHEDAQRLTFDDGTFSVVIDSETLEHVPDLEQALREIARVLKPGGRFRILEIVYSKDPRLSRRQRRMARLVEALYGARFDRHTLQLLQQNDEVKISATRFLKADTYLLIEGYKKKPTGEFLS